MSHRPDQLTDEAITQFLRSRSSDADLGLLEEVMRTVGTTPQEGPRLGLRPVALTRRTLLVVAIALLLAALGAIAVGSRLLRPDLTVERMTVVAQVVAAMNDRDAAALQTMESSFTADGTLEVPGIDARAGREGDVFVSDGWRPNSDWMGLVQPWDLEARLGSCRTPLESTVVCAVATRWHVLQVEIGEEWTFEFDGARVSRLQMIRVDPDPSNRVMPLGLVDLERWAAWLTETHPEQASRLLPTGPDPMGHWYFRFGGGANPHEIGDSIREYIASRP
jgi:hypothetical protein